jgi:hypothetical protein
MKKLTDPTTSWREFERRAATLSAELQKSLLAKHASEFLAINVETGEYLLATTSDDAWKQFRALAWHAGLCVSRGWRTGRQVSRDIAGMTPTARIEVIGGHQTIELTAIVDKGFDGDL